VVEVVVRPVRGEDRGIRSLVQVDQGDDVGEILGFLDRLGRVVEALEVGARPFLEQGHLRPAFEVLLVEPVAEERDPADPRLRGDDVELREPDGNSRLDERDQVRHDRERVPDRVDREPRLEPVDVRREDGIDDGHGVQEHREAGVLRGTEDRVVAAVPPEGLDCCAREVDADDARVVGVALDLASGALRVLRAGDQAPQKTGGGCAPPVDEPCVVGARQRSGVLGRTDERQLEQVVGEEDPDVDADRGQLCAHRLGGLDDPDACVSRGEGRPGLPHPAGRQARDVEVSLRHAAHRLERRAPRRVAVRGQRGSRLVDVNVAVDDENLGEALASGRPLSLDRSHRFPLSAAAASPPVRRGSRRGSERPTGS
jgi:hypothetical protein